MTEQIKLLESQIRDIYGRIIYTHKTHEKCADILKCRYDCFKYIDIVLSVITTSSIIFNVFGENRITLVTSLIASALLLGLKLFSYNYNLLAFSEKHKNAAHNLLEIREKFFSLLVDIRIGNKEVEIFQKRRDELSQQLFGVYRGSPKTISKAYQIASKGLKENEEFTFSDDEIDKFLPETMRRANEQ
jgi:hypothetical protein